MTGPRARQIFSKMVGTAQERLCPPYKSHNVFGSARVSIEGSGSS
jgi:hypothetical protein